jgi:hypothetical protein
MSFLSAGSPVSFSHGQDPEPTLPNPTDLLALQIEVGANVARDRERRAWVLAGLSGHGFKFGALIGEATVETLTGQRSPDAMTAWAAGRG